MERASSGRSGAVLIETHGMGVTLGGNRVLGGISISVRAREIVTVVGPNGSGKTTLIRLMIGALQPSEGRVTRAPGLVIGYVPQRLAIDHTMPLSVGRFLAFASADRDARTAALVQVGAPGLEARQMIDLSGGQFQRVMLAHALLRRPGLLVLDEAAQGLDQPGVAAFYQLVETLRTEIGCAVLLVSHDLHVVMAASDRVICLNGHVCCEGAPMHVSAAPEYRALFGHGTGGTFALYRHEHDHAHDHGDGAHPHHHHAPEPEEEGL